MKVINIFLLFATMLVFFIINMVVGIAGNSMSRYNSRECTRIQSEVQREIDQQCDFGGVFFFSTGNVECNEGPADVSNTMKLL
jgi:hypothetical protein